AIVHAPLLPVINSHRDSTPEDRELLLLDRLFTVQQSESITHHLAHGIHPLASSSLRSHYVWQDWQMMSQSQMRCKASMPPSQSHQSARSQSASLNVLGSRSLSGN